MLFRSMDFSKYVCLEACKSAFVTTCRPLIGLDGCFLKGEFGGQLLSVVGKDENNQMFPLAYAIVESKNYSSWKWFIDLLIADLDGIQEGFWAFISDQQKVNIYFIGSGFKLGLSFNLCIVFSGVG